MSAERDAYAAATGDTIRSLREAARVIAEPDLIDDVPGVSVAVIKRWLERALLRAADDLRDSAERRLEQW